MVAGLTNEILFAIYLQLIITGTHAHYHIGNAEYDFINLTEIQKKYELLLFEIDYIFICYYNYYYFIY